MKRSADVVVVGGGISGVCVAWELARRGVPDVILLERAYLASGPTGRSGAVIRCHYSTADLVRLALEGRRFFQQAADLVGDDCGYRQVGFLAVASEAEAPALERKVAMQRAAGLAVDLLSVSDVARIEPELAAGGIGLAAYESDSGYADPVRTTYAVARRAADLGVEIVQGSPVQSIRTEGGRVTGVVHAGGTIATRTVVCAAGPWTRRLVAEHGTDLPTSILRNAMALFLRPPEFVREHPVLIDSLRRFYARPYGTALSLAGSIDEHENQPVDDPDRYERGLTDDELRTFGARLGDAFPRLRGAADRGGWVGVYDVAPDWLHIIDELPGCAGLWVLCGTSGHGFKLAPAIGRLLVDRLLAGRATRPDMSMFALERLVGSNSRPAGFGVLS